MKFLLAVLLSVTSAWLTGCANREVTDPSKASAPVSSGPSEAGPVPTTNSAIMNSENIRNSCIERRKLICGRVVDLATNGIVVDSGYTDILRPPLGQSWVVPGTVSASRDPNMLELNEPGTPAVGLVFLTDFPKRPKAKKFDYVVLIGYPAGHWLYEPLPGIKKKIRIFSGGVDTAVRLTIQNDEKE